MIILTERQEKLFEFVKSQHGDQKRKYTFEPYWNHLLSVAEIVTGYNDAEQDVSIEVALCHDLLEDTKCTPYELMRFLTKNGYTDPEPTFIVFAVKELTDRYTKENFPQLNRKQRKDLESIRLGKISELAQTVKYADLIDNTSSIVKHDLNFAKTYILEKIQILSEMRDGNILLFIKCCHTVQEAINLIEYETRQETPN